EACDDGNLVNTDACLNDCSAASCGDGHVWAGVEECDDANAVNDDACTNACKLPACDDGIKNGAETATDCGGGTCPKCLGGQACVSNSDCITGNCLGNVCAAPQSCKQIHDGDPTLPSGQYIIDPDGPGVLIQP